MNMHPNTGVIATTLMLLAAAPFAQAQDLAEYYFFDWSLPRVIEYSSSRHLRICNDYRRHDVALEVICDGKRTILPSDQCLTCRARTLKLAPSKPLKDELTLSGSIKQVKDSPKEAGNTDRKPTEDLDLGAKTTNTGHALESEAVASLDAAQR
jgi:hypothetical protein